MKTKKNKVILLIIISTTIILQSCGVLMFQKIDCRGFENKDDLKWFAGKIGDTITFVKPDNTSISFIVNDKYILHRTKYISDTGCGCHDMWGILLTSNSDTISMYSQSKYVYDNKANRYDRLYVEIDKELASFTTENKSIIDDFEIDTVKFEKVIKFEFNHIKEKQFKRVYIAENIGIIQMERVNGEVWKNKDLTKVLNTDFNSFIYEETTCD